MKMAHCFEKIFDKKIIIFTKKKKNYNFDRPDWMIEESRSIPIRPVTQPITGPVSGDGDAADQRPSLL